MSHVRSSASLISLLTILGACSEPRGSKLEQVTIKPVKANTELKSVTSPEALLKALTPRVAKEVRESKVAVLWPAELGASAILVSEPLFYSVSGVVDSVLPSGQSSRATITVQGTREIHNREHVEQGETAFNTKLRGTSALYTRNEEIATTTWIESGVVYSVDVECSQIEDERCSGDIFVKSVSDSLLAVSRAAAGAQ
jgi:hypothetical protein